MLFNLEMGIGREVPLVKLVLMDSDLRPYLAALLAIVPYITVDAIHAPKTRNIVKLSIK